MPRVYGLHRKYDILDNLRNEPVLFLDRDFSAEKGKIRRIFEGLHNQSSPIFDTLRELIFIFLLIVSLRKERIKFVQKYP
jgi:hypothetical protein